MSEFSYTDKRLESKKSINGKLSARDITDVKINQMNGGNSHSKNLQRLLMERNDVFGIDSKRDVDIDDSGRIKQKNNKFGEITGNEYDDDINLRGLPIRSQYNVKKQVHDANSELNFDLYDNQPSKLNVGYCDNLNDGSTQYCGINESTTKMSTQVQPINMCSEKIDKLNNNLFYYLFDMIKKSTYVINGIGLFNLFSALYFASNSLTEIDLQKFFDLPKKNILYEGLSTINNKLKLCEHMINVKNFMLVGNDVPYNPNFYNNIKQMCILARLNINNPVGESTKVNEMICKICNTNVRHPVTPENIENLQLMFLTVAIINPIWAQPWNSIVGGIFQGFSCDKQVNYMRAINKSFGYFEDELHQLIEIKCHGDELVMGCLNYKYEFTPDVNDTDLHSMIQHMKNSMLSEVVVPMFENNIKLRMNNTLKNMGLNTVFIDIKSQKLFPKGIMLQDVIQNIKIKVTNAYKQSKNTYGGYKTDKRVVLNKPFIFYFRLVKTNTIILQGSFQ